jgi:hypothetical protein
MINISITTDNSLVINAKPIVHINTGISLVGYKSELPVTITADFTDVPKDQHEIYLQAFQYYYSKDIDILHNPFKEKPKTIKEKKREWTINRIIDVLFKTKQK